MDIDLVLIGILILSRLDKRFEGTLSADGPGGVLKREVRRLAFRNLVIMRIGTLR